MEPIKIVLYDNFSTLDWRFDVLGNRNLSHGETTELAFKKELLAQGVDLNCVEFIHVNADINGDGKMHNWEMLESTKQVAAIVENNPSIACVYSSIGTDIPWYDIIRFKGFKNKKTQKIKDKIAKQKPYFQALSNRRHWHTIDSDLDSIITVGNTQYGQQKKRDITIDPLYKVTTTADGFDLNGDGKTDAMLPDFTPGVANLNLNLDGNSYGTPTAAAQYVAQLFKVTHPTEEDGK